LQINQKEKKLVFVELNEINFDVVKSYLKIGVKLPAFNRIFKEGLLITKSELDYENLEPWIQWPSVHTGLNYEEHKTFRLGDFVKSNKKQFFEKVEEAGYKVGAISPMNASNNLVNPAYFIPDPWTQTQSDGSFFSNGIANAVSQAVNDNSSSKLTFSTILNLALAFIFLVHPLRLIPMIGYAINALGSPWRKALFLDKLLHEIHITLYKRKKPNFSTLFLNAGAHIQHHYYFNSPFVESEELKNPSWYIEESKDPFLEMLKVYDSILLDLFELKNSELIIATGLSQTPYTHLKFYYRLQDHKSFLDSMEIVYKDVVPRMTRDFLVTFNSIDEAARAESKLKEIYVDNKIHLFEEIDNRGKDLFVVLTYPHEIKEKTTINIEEKVLNLNEFTTFVAIKNGEHQEKGFAYFSGGVKKFAPTNYSHVSNIHNTVLSFFNVN
tara:strand:+ start:7305 stop:8621 length:1317 start_codon:yes stop_codon:yes gene_type:complete